MEESQYVYFESRRHWSCDSPLLWLLPLLWQMIDGFQIESFCLMGADVVEWFSHSGFVEFLSVLPCGQLRLPFLFTEYMKKYLISCLSVTISLNVSQSCFYILHPFSVLSRSLAVSGAQMFLFSSSFVKTLSLKFYF